MMSRFGTTARNYKHGHKSASGATGEYVSWSAMRARCCNPQNPNFARYGARGISVCERWREDFTAFLADMGRKPSPSHSIERIENNGNYEPGNCRWATKAEQANNRRSSRKIEFRGERLTLAQWEERTGINQDALHTRLKKGWTIERALTAPLRRIVKDSSGVGRYTT